MAPTVWTPRRKWLGNLIPLAAWLPLTVAGLVFYAKRHDPVPTLVLLAAGIVVAWLALNQFGLFENARMKSQLDRILRAKGELPDGESWFVGFASPQFKSSLDAHEDVGFLVMSGDRLTFVSETRQVQVAKAEVKQIRFRSNVHSIVGLGRWVSVEGVIGKKSIRLNVEPRERRTLLGNRAEGRKLLNQLRKWAKG